MAKEYKGNMIRDIPEGELIKDKKPKGESIKSEGAKGNPLWKDTELNEEKKKKKQINESKKSYRYSGLDVKKAIIVNRVIL